MNQPLSTRIAHRRGDHDYEAEYHATRGCVECYNLVGRELAQDPTYDAWVEDMRERRSEGPNSLYPMTPELIDEIEGAAEERDYQFSLGPRVTPRWLGQTKDLTGFVSLEERN